MHVVPDLSEVKNSIRLEMIENIEGIFLDEDRSDVEYFIARYNELIDSCVDEMLRAYEGDLDELVNREPDAVREFLEPIYDVMQ